MKNDELKDKLVEEIVSKAGIVTSKDLDSFFLDLQSRMYQSLLNAEINHHIKEENKEEITNKKNGHSSKGKKIKTNSGEITIDMPRDRKGTFDPIIISKRKRVTSDFSDFAILLYSKGNSLKDIKSIIKEAYKIELSETFISELIKEVSEDVEKWQNRPLERIYPFMYVDCLYCPVKVEGKSKKLAIYVMLGINIKGIKEVVGIWIGDGSEAASYWTGLFNEKEVKEIIKDVKKIYQSNNLEEAKEMYKEFMNKYKDKKIVLKQVELSIEHIYSLFEVPESVRKIIYTTNPIESLNSALRRVTNGKGMFENKESLMRVLYLRTIQLEEKWNKGTNNWKNILKDLVNIHEERITKYLVENNE